MYIYIIYNPLAIVRLSVVSYADPSQLLSHWSGGCPFVPFIQRNCHAKKPNHRSNIDPLPQSSGFVGFSLQKKHGPKI